MAFFISMEGLLPWTRQEALIDDINRVPQRRRDTESIAEV
jgi:hypothetical protein